MARTSTTPRRTPSRQSTRIITPVQSHSNYVRPSHDLRRSVARNTQNTSANLDFGSESGSIIQSQRTHPSKKKDIHNTFSLGEEVQGQEKEPTDQTDSEFDGVEGALDLAQDSDQENAKVKKPRIKNNDPFDYIRNYFEPPFYASVTDTGEKQMYKCKWCASDYKKGIGTTQTSTNTEMELWPVTHAQHDLRPSNRNAAFNTLVFNQLLMIWLIRFSLPWSRFDDFLLSVTFNYVRQEQDSARQEHYNDDDVLEANKDEDPDSWETPEEGKIRLIQS
ncbi:hypothetical protein H4Q26_004964 [Puccinia striiformis f. sp. tritici PST-130]|nr:hypothetical protein H4Q26_004964 [Puccinia striiformis f. sp. tritici PST-130]